MTPKTPKLATCELGRSYHTVVALRPTNLEVQDGEFLTLLGPSGSGKTTMLQLIAGLVEPTTGEVWIDGVETTRQPPFKRDIGLVFQNYALFPHLTVYENIAFPLRMRRKPKAEIDRAVREVLDLVRLPHVAERLPRELSGGQQQRIALARCIVYRPSIVLMDEPLGALDKKLREQMQLEIKRLHTDLGTTIIYVTHDQEEALTMSDRICLMRDGAIEQIGPANDLYFNPRTAFAANFLGESNLFDGREFEPRGDLGTVSINGKGFCGRYNERVSHGGDAKYLVRPENVRLLLDGDDADNVMSGDLIDVYIVGGVTKFHVRLPDGSSLMAHKLTRLGDGQLQRGLTVRIGWDSTDALILPGAP